MEKYRALNDFQRKKVYGMKVLNCLFNQFKASDARYMYY